MDWIVPPHSYVAALSPHGMAFRDGDFGGWLREEGGALMSGISALTRRDVRKLASPLSLHRVQRSGRGLPPHRTMLAPWSRISSLQNREKQASVVGAPIYVTRLQQPSWLMSTPHYSSHPHPTPRGRWRKVGPRTTGSIVSCCHSFTSSEFDPTWHTQGISSILLEWIST